MNRIVIAAFAGPGLPLIIDTSAGGPTDRFWDFGDGATSTEQNPAHTYIAPGTYTVNLTATNADGSSTATKSDYIRVVTPHLSQTSLQT